MDRNISQVIRIMNEESNLVSAGSFNYLGYCEEPFKFKPIITQKQFNKNLKCHPTKDYCMLGESDLEADIEWLEKSKERIKEYLKNRENV